MIGATRDVLDLLLDFIQLSFRHYTLLKLNRRYQKPYFPKSESARKDTGHLVNPESV
jgi:hypothetical protein